MSQEKPFLLSHADQRKAEATQEQGMSIPEFTAMQLLVEGKEEDRALLESVQAGNLSELSEHERQRFIQMQNEWWEGQGPGRNKDGRREHVRNALASGEGSQALMHEKALTEALASGDAERIAEVKRMYFETYPEEREGIEVLFGYASYLEKDVLAAQLRAENKQVPAEALEELAGYQTELMQYMVKHDGREFLASWWHTMDRIAQSVDDHYPVNPEHVSHHKVSRFEMFRHGMLSQIGLYRGLEQLGLNPDSPTPLQDFAYSIDLWTEKGDAIQLKASRDNFEVIKISLDEDATIGFPGVRVEDGTQVSHYNTQGFDAIQKSALKAREYAKRFKQRTGQGFDAYFIVLPLDGLDPITGEPNAELLAKMQSTLGGTLPEGIEPLEAAA